MASIRTLIRLIPYIALSGALAYLLTSLPQSTEYLSLIRETASAGLTLDLGLKYVVIGVYYLLFCFLVGKSLQEIFIDDAGQRRSKIQRFIFVVLFSILFAVPIVVVLRAILGAQASFSGGDLVACAIAALGLIGIALIALKITRLSPLGRRRQSEHYFSSWSIAACLVLITALFASHSVDVVKASALFGTIGILVATLACAQAALLLVADGRRQGYPVVSALLCALIVGQLGALLFGSSVSQPRSKTPAVSVPEAASGFKDWLTARRSKIEAYGARNQGRAYPVFVVAAQGGGYYAAYHAALFLARLQDRCPSFSDHTFAISAVSGGSLGAAVFAETVSAKAGTSGAKDDGICRKGPLPEKAYEDTVRRFFNFDFLTPLVASTLLFDMPAALVPLIHFGPDRGTALQKSFDAAWRNATGATAGGFSDPFYGRWKADRPVPALFFNTTSVNLGIPNLISELDLRASSRYGELSVLLDTLDKEGDPDGRILTALREQIGFSQLSFVNTLQFNESPSFSLSFAVTSSARFPFVTPTSLIDTGAEPENALFARIKTLQLLDGGMVDNSGLFTASEIKKKMDEVLGMPEFVGLKGKLKIHLVTFSHEAVALYKPDVDTIPEGVAPLVAFDRIRMSRRSSFEDLKKKFDDAVHEVTLFDSAFSAPLSWSLSTKTKGEIEKRAGGIDDGSAKADEQICCLMKPGAKASDLLRAFTEGANKEGTRVIFAPGDVDEWKRRSEAGQQITNRPFVANATSFEAIIRELGYKP